MLDAIRSVLTSAPEAWLDAMLRSMPHYAIDERHEICSCLATVAFESREFTRLEEYLTYSKPERLVAVWPTRFYLPPDVPKLTRRNALEYTNQPQKLAEYVYGGRMENGPEGCGDGYLYRGRGPGQLTGRRNYRRATEATGLDVLGHPELMLEPETGAQVTCWAWRDHGLDAVDDDDSIAEETRKWQGAQQDLAARQRILDRLLEATA